jgi:hypothetical protein
MHSDVLNFKLGVGLVILCALIHQHEKGPTINIMKLIEGRWRLHGRDDLKLTLKVPLDNPDKLRGWLRSSSDK